MSEIAFRVGTKIDPMCHNCLFWIRGDWGDEDVVK